MISGDHDVPRNPRNENVSNALIEYQFDWYARIGTREHGGERLLFFFSVLLEDGKVVFEGR